MLADPFYQHTLPLQLPLFISGRYSLPNSHFLVHYAKNCNTEQQVENGNHQLQFR